MHVVQTLIDTWAETRKERALATLLGVDAQRLSKWKNGHLPIPDKTFVRLLDAVNPPNKADVAMAFLREKAEKISETFRTLLRRGMAATSRGCVLA